MAASVNIFKGWGILKNQKIVQKLRKIAIKIDCNMYISKCFSDQASINNITSEDAYRGCHDVLRD